MRHRNGLAIESGPPAVACADAASAGIDRREEEVYCLLVVQDGDLRGREVARDVAEAKSPDAAGAESPGCNC